MQSQKSLFIIDKCLCFKSITPTDNGGNMKMSEVFPVNVGVVGWCDGTG